jgi:hypothetical protein
MTTSLRDALTQRINEVGPAHLDIEELVGLGERRLRRRRIAALVSAGAAVGLAIALAVGPAALNLSADPDQVPIDQPTNSHEKQTNSHESQTTTRPLVYSDVTFVPGGGPNGLLGDPIHVGDRVVDTGSGFVNMDVTDDGVVYTTGDIDDIRVWFTDGGTPAQIGSHACKEVPYGWPDTVVTGNSGSLAAWLDCTRGLRQPQLVVYDTGSGREVAREPVTECGGYGRCLPYAVIGDHVYFERTHDDGDTSSLLEVDAATGLVSRVTLAEGAIDPGQSPSYLDDIRSHPRGLVIGDSWDTGTPQQGSQFAVVGTRLVPIYDDRLTSAFDTATRRPIRLHLPAGYKPDPAKHDDGGFGLFEWLDDDTVALENFRTGRHDQDILTCRLSTGRCELAVPTLGRDRAYRVVQGEDLGDVSFGIHE